MNCEQLLKLINVGLAFITDPKVQACIDGLKPGISAALENVKNTA